MTMRAVRYRIGLILVVGLLSACGKKGPPLPPLPRIPQIPAAVGLRQVGPQVYVWFDPPAANVDGSQPAEIRWIALYRDPPPQPLRLAEAAHTWPRTDAYRHPTLDRWLVPWTAPQPGCYRLALFNHRRKTAGPSAPVCYPQDLPQPPALHASLTAVAEGVRITGDAVGLPVEIFRVRVARPEVRPADPVLHWPWQPIHVLPASPAPWSWTDTDVQDEETYLYALRPRLYREDPVWISGPGTVLGPLTYIDRFAPPPPETLEVRPEPGGWQLQWSPVLTPDWGGYRVYIRSATHPEWVAWQKDPYPFTRLRLERSQLEQRGLLDKTTEWIEFQVRALDNKKPPNESASGPLVRQSLVTSREDHPS